MKTTVTTDVKRYPAHTFRTELALGDDPALAAPMGLEAFNKLIDETVNYEQTTTTTDTPSTDPRV